MGNTIVLDISGRVTIGHDAKMRDAIQDALESGAQNILLSMSGVTKLDSSGIGELVAAHITVTRGGGRFILVGLPPRLAGFLQITNLVGVLETYDHVSEALAALEGGSEPADA